MKILILEANPKRDLDLNQEIRDLKDAIQRASDRQEFEIEVGLAVRSTDLQDLILKFEPNIIHFCGHGTGEDGLVFLDRKISTDALSELCELCQKHLECVVLNACYSQVQADEIVKHINYVIGMNQTIRDDAAIAFSIGFYRALGYGRSIEDAYKFGKNAIQLAISDTSINRDAIVEKTRKFIPVDIVPDITITEEHLKPVLKKKANSNNPESFGDSNSWENPEGLVSLNSPFYIERPPIESECYETIVRSGALIRVKAPRQMGKSSLMVRILHYASQQKYQTAGINFQEADAKDLTSIDLFLQWFCRQLTDLLNLEDKVADSWQDRLGSKSNCTNYFQRYLLSTITEPLVLGLDEVDQVFQHPETASDFFGLLRAWHEKGKNEAIWQKLRLVIVHSKEVYIPLNINQSPFNVGLPIELPELNQAQITDLVQRYRLNWSTKEIKQLMGIVDGHPYLLRVALDKIAKGRLTLKEFVRVAPTEEGPYGDHLHRHLINLKNDASLEAAMRQVVTTDKPTRLEPSQAFKLRSMGLVELCGNDVIPLCNLYRLYFYDTLGVNE
jgi:hypothetical protein